MRYSKKPYTSIFSPTLCAFFLALVLTQSVSANDSVGEWGESIDFPIVPIHNVLMPNGKVMMYGTDPRGDAGSSGVLLFMVWDPALGTGPDSYQVMDNVTRTDIFCGSQILLSSSGKVFTAGGDNADRPGESVTAATTLYDPSTNTITDAGSVLNFPRWYPTSITLPDGNLLIQGGSTGLTQGSGILTPEVFSDGQGWRSLVGATSDFAYGDHQKRWWYPRSWVLSDGRVFSISGSAMFFVDSQGPGHLTQAGSFPTDNIGASSTAVMFAPDKILQVGGGHFTDSGGPPASMHASIVDVSGASPVVMHIPPPALARHWANTTLLADGQVLLSGGSLMANDLSQPACLTPELWNPATGQWSPLAPDQKARLYHSSTLLLPDGRVFSNGGGSPGPILQRNGQIFSPPYLFDGSELAARPSYTLTRDDFGYGDMATLTVTSAQPIARVTLVKTASVTHSFNTEQRILDLAFTVDGQALTASLPTSANMATPGYYMLFLIDQGGTPSKAEIVRLAHADSPAATNLVQDGGFETLRAPADGWLDFAAGATLGPWSVTAGNVSLHDNGHRGLGLGGASGAGHIDLDAAPNGGVLEQEIAGLEPDSEYVLSFDYAKHDLAEASATARVTISGFTAEVTPVVSGTSRWLTASFTFTAVSEVETLAFEGISSEGLPQTGVLIDGVAIVPRVMPPGPVPAMLVGDGGFESLEPANGEWIDVAAGGSVGPWSVVAGNVSVHSESHHGLGLGTGAPGGDHIDLDASPAGGVLQQPIDGLVPEASYRLRFSYAKHDLAGLLATADVRIGDLVTTVMPSESGDRLWLDASLEFTAVNATEMLTFTGLTSGGIPKAGVLIDGVSVTPITVGEFVSDGGFETLDPSEGSWIDVGAGGSVGPWAVVAGNVSVHSASHRGLGSGSGAPGGDHVDLDSGVAGGVIQQTIEGLVPGTQYTLTFDYAKHDLAGASASAKFTIADLTEVEFFATESGMSSWAQASYTFTASAVAEILTFTGLTSGGIAQAGMLIDGVSIR